MLRRPARVQLHFIGPGRHVSGALQTPPGQHRSIFFVPHVHSQPFVRMPSQSSKFVAHVP